jgi:hypothetical protein
VATPFLGMAIFAMGLHTVMVPGLEGIGYPS